MQRFKNGQTVFGVDGDDVREIKLECDITDEEVKFYWSLDAVYATIADAVYHVQQKAVERCRKTLLKADKVIEDYYHLNHNNHV